MILVRDSEACIAIHAKEGKKMIQMQSLLFAVNKNMISYLDVFPAIRCKESRTINSASSNVIHSTEGTNCSCVCYVIHCTEWIE
jgi:hypothetical protein